MAGFLGNREDYGSEALDEFDLSGGPFAIFHRWLDDAVAAGIFEPTAFVLGTLSAHGAPQARTVLLRELADQGFKFFTNYESRKGVGIEQDPRVSMVFGWYPIYRQVLVEGTAFRVSPEESDAYFATRPRGSQIGAWASRQSSPMATRQELEQQVAEVTERFEGVDPLPRPDFWGGYVVVPHRIEFWKGRSSRLHDRIVFTRSAESDQWQLQRLQP